MKYLLILIFLFGFSVFVILAPDSYGLIMGYPMEFWDSADIILDGIVISTREIDSENLIQHDVMVEQFFKNKKSQQMITVYGVSAYNTDWFYPVSFKTDDRVLFYLKKINDKYFILEHSRKATEQCTPRDMIGLSTLPGEGLARGGPTLFFDPYQTCNGFLTPAGFVRDSLPPLKQIEAGIAQGDVGCKHDHYLMFRENGSVACVMQSSVLPLMDRGWMHVENQEHLQFKSALPTVWLDAPKQIDDTTLLDFTIEIMDFVENNDRPTITILDENQNVVWSGQHNNPFNEGWSAFAGSGHSVQYAMHDFPEFVKIDAGQYMLSVSLDNQKITKKLTVTESEPSPEPEPMSESEILQKQKQQQAKISVQKTIMTDFRGHEYAINAINEYRNKFENGYFLEQFITPNKQNYEKNDSMKFVFVEWGYQPQECTFPKIEVYFRSYDNYNSIEKTNEWQRTKEGGHSIYSDSDGYLIANDWPIGIFDLAETCTIPGEYRVVASNIQDESKKEFGYYTCQKEKLDGMPQPWMELPE